MAIRGVRHVALSTSALEAAIRRWVDVLGFEVIRTWSWSGSELVDSFIGISGSSATAALLRGHGFEVELFEFDHPEALADRDANPPGRPVSSLGYTHLCFEVDDMDHDVDHLRGAGFDFWQPPVTAPDGARIVYCRDPEGNVIELHQVALDHP